ncbi:MAG: ferrous iron transport protein A [Bacteroidetes bacterium]|nr:MAG: ferrous iron transport protein A [Bacteroidota bacterium]
MVYAQMMLQHNQLEPAASQPEAGIRLSRVTKGAAGRIVHIDDPEVRIALLRMGVSEGDVFRVTDIAPLGDPMAIALQHTKLFLRKRNAAHIWISLQ